MIRNTVKTLPEGVCLWGRINQPPLFKAMASLGKYTVVFNYYILITSVVGVEHL